MAVPSFLARERIVARPGFNRWLIPPAALAVHLCIGQAYATSVYKTALVEPGSWVLPRGTTSEDGNRRGRTATTGTRPVMWVAIEWHGTACIRYSARETRFVIGE